MDKLIISFFLCCFVAQVSLAKSKNKHLRWKAKDVALVISWNELNSNLDGFESIKESSSPAEIIAALEKLAWTNNNLYEWTKSKISKDQYLFNAKYFSWLVDICHEMVKMGNLSSPTAILSAIIYEKGILLDTINDKDFKNDFLVPQLGKNRAERFVRYINAFCGKCARYLSLEKNKSYYIPNAAFWGKEINFLIESQKDRETIEKNIGHIKRKFARIQASRKDSLSEINDVKPSVLNYFSNVVLNANK